jgi:hypothetical protein
MPTLALVLAKCPQKKQVVIAGAATARVENVRNVPCKTDTVSRTNMRSFFQKIRENQRKSLPSRDFMCIF